MLLFFSTFSLSPAQMLPNLIESDERESLLVDGSDLQFDSPKEAVENVVGDGIVLARYTIPIYIMDLLRHTLTMSSVSGGWECWVAN